MKIKRFDNAKKVILITAMSLGFLTSCGYKKYLPVDKDKCTFYFKLDKKSVVLEDYESIYLTGGAFSWADGLDALEFKKLEGKNKIYYAQVDKSSFNTKLDEGLECQLAIGYNSNSNLPDSYCGLVLENDRKADECIKKSLKFKYSSKKTKVDLGELKFSNSLEKPVKNCTFSVEFEEKVPDYCKVLFFSSFENYKNLSDCTEEEAREIVDQVTMKTSDNKVYSYIVDSILPGSYNCKVLVEYDYLYKNIQWNYVDQTNAKTHTFFVNDENCADSTIDIFDGTKLTYKSLEDPKLKKIPLTLRIINTGGSLNDIEVGIAGNWANWSINGNMCEKLNENELIYKAEVNGKIMFGIMSDPGWADMCISSSGSFFEFEIDYKKSSVEIIIYCDFSLFGHATQFIPNNQVVINYSD